MGYAFARFARQAEFRKCGREQKSHAPTETGIDADTAVVITRGMISIDAVSGSSDARFAECQELSIVV